MKDMTVHRVRYEDLMTDPIGELKCMAHAFDFNLDVLTDAFKSDYQLEPSHGVAGNRLRRKGTQNLCMDEEWKSSLPQYARALVWLIWPVARSYGYRLDMGG